MDFPFQLSHFHFSCVLRFPAPKLPPNDEAGQQHGGNGGEDVESENSGDAGEIEETKACDLGGDADGDDEGHGLHPAAGHEQAPGDGGVTIHNHAQHGEAKFIAEVAVLRPEEPKNRSWEKDGKSHNASSKEGIESTHFSKLSQKLAAIPAPGKTGNGDLNQWSSGQPENDNQAAQRAHIRHLG